MSKDNEQPVVVPEDLDVKIGSKEEAFWTEVKEKAKQGILNAKRETQINEHVIKLAEKIIEKEQKV
tara:strand:- start:226 stop:423 length:198 start_codon:yes stop_codon:yes gene_type:complete